MVSAPPAPLDSTPERMPAVMTVPVLPLLLTVTVLTAMPKLMGLVISVSPKAVVEPRTKVVGLNPVVVPQVKGALAVAPTARETTSRSVVPAAKPAVVPNETVPVPATDAAKARAKVVPPTSRTPPLRVIGLSAGMPTPTTERKTPPVTEVTPV